MSSVLLYSSVSLTPCVPRSAGGMTQAGSVFYMASEVIDGDFDTKADVFSFGVTMAEIVMACMVGKPVTRFDTAARKAMIADAVQHLNGVCPLFGQFLDTCCQRKPKHRVSSMEALAWLEDIPVPRSVRPPGDLVPDGPAPAAPAAPAPAAAAAAGEVCFDPFDIVQCVTDCGMDAAAERVASRIHHLLSVPLADVTKLLIDCGLTAVDAMKVRARLQRGSSTTTGTGSTSAGGSASVGSATASGGSPAKATAAPSPTSGGTESRSSKNTTGSTADDSDSDGEVRPRLCAAAIVAATLLRLHGVLPAAGDWHVEGADGIDPRRRRGCPETRRRREGEALRGLAPLWLGRCQPWGRRRGEICPR